MASTCRNWMLFHRVLSGSKGVSVFFADYYRNGLYCLFVPIIVYLMCWFARNCYVKQLQQETAFTLKYRNLHYYTCLNVTMTFLTSFVVVSPLVADDDFSLSNGFFRQS